MPRSVAESASIAPLHAQSQTSQPIGWVGSRAGSQVLALTPLLWIVQAALLAHSVQLLAAGGGLAGVIWPGVVYLMLGIVRASAEAWASRQLFKAARRCVSDARAQACSALARSSPMDRGRTVSGQAASVLAEQAEALLPWLLRYQPARWRVMIAPPVIAVVVASQSWLAALILVGAAPLIPLAMALIGWRAKAASEAHLQALGGMNGFLLDRLRGLSTLRALGAVDATARRLRSSAEDLRKRTMQVLRIAFLSSAALELFSALAVALVAVYVGFHLLGQLKLGSWGRPLHLDEGLFILLLAPAFFEPLRELSAVWHDKAAGQAALDALAGLRRHELPLLGALPSKDLPSVVLPAPHAQALSVQLRGLRFGYAGAAPVFDGFDLHIGAGEHVALVGPSGAGKTTLLSAIAGLVPVLDGAVLINGLQLDEHCAAGLRGRMAWIGQRPHVFAGTVQDNVTLHRPGISHDAASAALGRAGLAVVAKTRLSGSLGEGGAGLSGGEVVRLALARAAVSDAAGLWLLDEPTAHLDSSTSQAVVDALLQAACGRTLIVATHDLALAARIGRIIHINAIHAASTVGGRHD